MSKYSNLNKSALQDLIKEIPEDYMKAQWIVVTDETTNPILKEILEKYDASKQPSNAGDNSSTDNQPSTETQSKTTKPELIAIKHVEKAVQEEGQFIAWVYGDQQAISEELKKHTTVRVMIPLMEGEPKGSTQYIGLNGASFHVTKGKMVDLPEPLAQIIDNSYKLDLGDVEKLELDTVSLPKELA